MRAWLFSLTLLACAARADVEVVSPRADATSVTIYRDLFALITETRTVDLPEGPVTLTFEGVVETLLPQSVALQQLDREFVERNYDFDRLGPSTLLGKSIGNPVTLVRTMPGSGRIVRARAIVVAAGPDGVTLRTEDGSEALRCSGLPEHVELDRMPDGLHAQPKLSVRLAPGRAGRRTVRVSYLASGFAWRSDYVARLDEAGSHMDLSGWLTLHNLTGASLDDADVQVVAGRLNLLDADDGGSSTIGATSEFEDEGDRRSTLDTRIEELEDEEGREDFFDEDSLALLTGCYPQGPPPSAFMIDAITSEDIARFPDRYLAEALQRIPGISINDAEEIVVTGFRASAVREELGDYQLYRLPWRTDLHARQTKQALFLHEPRVRIERFYSARIVVDEYRADDGPFERPAAKLAFENRRSAGLGVPLPAGVVRFFEDTEDGDVFVGEARMSDRAAGSPVELTLAGALDLSLRIDHEEPDDDSDDARVTDVRIGIASAKSAPVSLEIRLALDAEQAGARVQRASQRVGRKSGDYAWRIPVPANGARELTFRLRVPGPGGHGGE